MSKQFVLGIGRISDKCKPKERGHPARFGNHAGETPTHLSRGVFALIGDAPGHNAQAIPAGIRGRVRVMLSLANENLSDPAPLARSPRGGGGGFCFRCLFRNQHPPDYRERESPFRIRGDDPRTIYRLFVADRAARRSGVMAADRGCPELEALAEITPGESARDFLRALRRLSG